MKPAFIVVDDFYEDPDAILTRALTLTYAKEEGVNYPGVMAPTFQDVEPIVTSFASLLGGIDIKHRGPQGSFRITTEHDMAIRTSLVHLDSSDFSAVIHLSKAETEGTYFYRHKALDVAYVTPEINQRRELHDAIVRDTLLPAAWEIVHTIPAKYNRLVIFDGKYFHSGARRLQGTSLADGRITQNFFFYRA